MDNYKVLVKSNKLNQSYTLDDIAGTSHADKLGYTVTYWMYSEDRKAWVLDPEYFTIML